MYKPATTVSIRETAKWLWWLSAAWGIYHLVGAAMGSNPLRYLASWAASLPGFISATVPFAFAAGAVAWADQCEIDQVRALSALLPASLGVAAASLALALVVHPPVFALYCDAFVQCDSQLMGRFLSESRLQAVRSAAWAPLNAALAYTVAELTVSHGHASRVRTERWFLLGVLWLISGILGDVLAMTDAGRNLGTWTSSIATMILPASVAAALWWSNSQGVRNANTV